MDQSQERLWKIGQVADRAGVSVDTVRYYERRGLVTPAHRATSGYRYYRPDVADRIRLARSLQALGMTLDEVTQALQSHDLEEGTCASQRWRLEAVRERITTQLAELTATLHDIDAALANCASGNCTLLTSRTPAIVCDMTGAPDTLAERMEEYARLFQTAYLGRDRDQTGARWLLRADPGVEEWARDLANRENACCAFMTSTVTRQGDLVIWHMTTIDDEAAKAVLDVFHDLPTHRLTGHDGYRSANWGPVQRERGRGGVVGCPRALEPE